MIAPDSRAEHAVDSALGRLATFADRHPAAFSIRSQTFAAAMAWWTRRRRLAAQLRACGGKSPRLFESNATRAVRVERLARTGEDA